MQASSKKAFTMIELVFVIVVIGILSAIAVPKFSATRDDAIITKARATVASLRSAIASERQKRILRGDFTPISSLDSGSAGTANSPIFDRYDNNTSSDRVLEYSLRTCKTGETDGCWLKQSNGVYRYYMPHNNTYADFNVSNSRMDCVSTTAGNCDLLAR